MASTQLHKTFSAAGNRKTFTLSFWVKRTNLSTGMYVFNVGNQEANPQAGLEFQSNDKLTFWNGNGAVYKNFITTQVFRDPSSWYHLVFSIDTTQSTASDRVKIYVNGEQITSFSTADYPDQNYDYEWNGTQRHTIGAYYNNQSYFDGILSHIHFIDGTAYPASTFGSTDSVTGEWKINTSPSVSYGTNGFFILKDGNSVTDQSGNSNNFTVAGGTLTNTEDCPSNVFATLNRLQRSRNNTNNGGDYLTQGNNTFDTSSSSAMKAVVLGTIGVQSRKYYWEYKVITNSRLEVGISQANVMGFTSPYYDLTTFSTIAMNASGQISGRYTGSAIDQFSSGTSNTTNDIIGLALDMDNKALYIHKNGTYLSNGTAVGVPTSGSSRTGSLIEPLAGSRDDYIPDGQFIFPYVHDVSTSGVAKAEFNFGNGFFGTTQISSEGTNASGNGKFEYDVPTGYTALSTKGLNL